MEERQEQNLEEISDASKLDDTVEEKQQQNLKNNSNAPTGSDNIKDQRSTKFNKDENEDIDKIDYSFDWENDKLTNEELRMELAFKLYNVPSVWKVPANILINYLIKKDDNSDKNLKAMDEIRFACKNLIDSMENYSEYYQLVAFTMQRMSPLLLEMQYSNMKSNNESYNFIERINNLALVQASADFATDLINSRKLYYMNISTNFRKLIINLKQTYQRVNNSNTDNNETNSKMMKVIHSNLQHLTYRIAATTFTSKVNKLPFGTNTNKSITSRRKEIIFETIEANDDENASTSGLKDIAYKRNKINIELKLQIDMHKRNAIKNIINAMITISNSVQQFNSKAHSDARQMLKSIHRAETIALEMKYSKKLSDEQSQCVTSNFSACIRFAHRIVSNISALIENIEKIIAYLKLNEIKLLLLDRNSELQLSLINFESKLCDNLAEFDIIIDASEAASDLFENTELESLFYLPTREVIRCEKIFYNHLSEFVSLSRNFSDAWNANDAFADMLQYLLIFIMNDDDDNDDNDYNGGNDNDKNDNASDNFCTIIPNGTNLECASTDNNDTQISDTNLSFNYQSNVTEELKDEISEEIISKKTTKTKSKKKINKSKKKRRR
uniref:Bm9256 n=2 Tax=Brugia malayi TaxID=6279 RepID=A0A8L7TL04_BRUMA